MDLNTAFVVEVLGLPVTELVEVHPILDVQHLLINVAPLGVVEGFDLKHLQPFYKELVAEGLRRLRRDVRDARADLG